jgi:hypothetical protein
VTDEAVLATLFTLLPLRRILGNTYAAGRILIQ